MHLTIFFFFAWVGLSFGFMHYHKLSCKSSLSMAKKIGPNPGESLEDYRKAIIQVIREESRSNRDKISGKDLLKLIVQKWGVAYDVRLRKTEVFGEGGVYLNIMWNYYGQKSFRMSGLEYLQHLEAIAQYLTAMNQVKTFISKVQESQKRPNAYFGYAVSIPLEVDPNTVDEYFKGMELEDEN